jgi:hypothetical protein
MVINEGNEQLQNIFDVLIIEETDSPFDHDISPLSIVRFSNFTISSGEMS